MIHINKIFEQSIIFYVITEQFFELFMLTTIALSRFFEINFKQDFHSAPPTTNLHMSLILKFISLKFFFPLTLSQMWCSVTYGSSLENLLQGYQFFFHFCTLIWCAAKIELSISTTLIKVLTQVLLIHSWTILDSSIL